MTEKVRGEVVRKSVVWNLRVIKGVSSGRSGKVGNWMGWWWGEESQVGIPGKGESSFLAIYQGQVVIPFSKLSFLFSLHEELKGILFSPGYGWITCVWLLLTQAFNDILMNVSDCKVAGKVRRKKVGKHALPSLAKSSCYLILIRLGV